MLEQVTRHGYKGVRQGRREGGQEGSRDELVGRGRVTREGRKNREERKRTEKGIGKIMGKS